MTAAAIAHLRIKLDDVDLPVLRRVQVPVTIRLDRLHLVLQAAMGWTNSHLYEIRARDVGWGVPAPDWGSRRPPIFNGSRRIAAYHLVLWEALSDNRARCDEAMRTDHAAVQNHRICAYPNSIANGHAL